MNRWIVLIPLFLFATNGFSQNNKVFEAPAEQYVRWHHLITGKSIEVGINHLDKTHAPNWVRWSAVAPDTTLQHFGSSTGMVSLEVDHDYYDDASVACDYTFGLEVISYDTAFNKSIDTINLEVQYTPQSPKKIDLDRSTRNFYNVVYMQVNVISIYDNITKATITNPNNNLILKSRIETERYYRFDTDFKCQTSWAGANFKYSGRFNKFIITRPGCDSVFDATEWEIEWTYVDNYYHDNSYIGTSPTTLDTFQLDPTEVDYDFVNNATRVRLPISEQSYSISNVFDQGYVLVRIRFLGRKGQNYELTLEGDWFPSAPAGKVSAYPSWARKLIDGVDIPTHEDDSKTWQYVASYAEDGKNKEVVSYYDGLNKTRQAVTTLNTDNVTVVGESVYDYEGRPAVNILPVPINKNGILRYYDTLNVNVIGSVTKHYNASNFDNKNIPDSLDKTTGASKYYSGNNSLLSDYNDFIPQAHGYPFTQTTFTKDGTGRVTAQSGVGKHHKIGSGHEITYMYGKPPGEILERMFGAEVGNEIHYKENIVFDANGQASVSYIDQHGRVILTSLAGDSPDNLIALDSHVPSGEEETITRNLHLGNNDSLSNHPVTSYELTYPYVALKSGTYNFWYQFQPESYVFTCNSICFDCFYDLSIEISKAGDTTVVYDTTLTVTPETSLDLTNSNSVLLKLWGGSNIDDTEFGVTLDAGKYIITKKLEVNLDHFNEYWNLYLASNNSCLLPFDSFLIDAYKYTTDCDSMDLSIVDTINAICQSMHDAMLKDISPGGQYGAYKLGGKFFGPEGEISKTQYQVHYKDVSIYNQLNILGTDFNGDFAYYLNSSIHYIDEKGDVDSIYLDSLGAMEAILLSNGAGLPEIIKHWKSGWGDSLLCMHPEYSIYKSCLEFQVAFEFNDNINNIETFDEAVENGYISASDSSAILNKDPMYNLAKDRQNNSSFGADTFAYRRYKDGMDKLITHTYKSGTTKYSLEEFAAKIACAQISKGTGDCDNPRNFGYVGLSTEHRNAQWNAYRARFNGFRWKCLEDFLTAHAGMRSNHLSEYPHNLTNFATYHGSLTTHTGAQLFKNKIPRFYYASTGMPDIDMFSNDPATVSSQLIDTVAYRMTTEATTRCSTYIDMWKEELSTCDMTANQMDSIISGFLEVCQSGYNSNNPLGTSTLNTPSSPHSFTSFDDVLNYFISPLKADNNYCNHLLINMPPPMGHAILKDKSDGDLDCGCELLQKVGNELRNVTVTNEECIEWETIPDYNFADALTELLNELSDANKIGNYKGVYTYLDSINFHDFNNHLKGYLDTSNHGYSAEVSVSYGNLIIHLRERWEQSSYYNIMLYDFNPGAYPSVDFSNIKQQINTKRLYPVSKFTIKATSVSSTGTITGYAPGLEDIFFIQKGGKRCIKKKITKSEVAQKFLDLSALGITKEEYYALYHACHAKGYKVDYYEESSDDSLKCVNGEDVGSAASPYCDGSGDRQIDATELQFTVLMNEMAKQDLMNHPIGFKRNNSKYGDSISPKNFKLLPDSFITYRSILEPTYYEYNNFWLADYAEGSTHMKWQIWGGYIGVETDLVHVKQCYLALGALNPADAAALSNINDLESIWGYRYDYIRNMYVVDALDKNNHKYTLQTFNCRQRYCDNPRFEYIKRHKSPSISYMAGCENAKKSPLIRFLKAIAGSTFVDTNATNILSYDGYNDECNNLFRASTNNVHIYKALNAPMNEHPMGDTLLAMLGDPAQFPAYLTFYMTDTTVFDWDEITDFKHLTHDSTAILDAVAQDISTYAATFKFLVWAFNGTDSVLIKGSNNAYSMGTCFKMTVPDSTEEYTLPAKIKDKCSKCADCDTMAYAINQFYSEYPKLGYNHVNHDAMITNYLNNYFNNNMYTNEYQQFFDECEFIDVLKSRRNECAYSFVIPSSQASVARQAIDALNDTLYKFTGSQFSYIADSLSTHDIYYCFNLWTINKDSFRSVYNDLEAIRSTYMGISNMDDPISDDTFSISIGRIPYTAYCRSKVREWLIDSLPALFPAASFDSIIEYRKIKFGTKEYVNYSLSMGITARVKKKSLRYRLDTLLHKVCYDYEFKKPFWIYDNLGHFKADTICSKETSTTTVCETCEDIRQVVKDFKPSKGQLAKHGYTTLLRNELYDQYGVTYITDQKRTDCEDCNQKKIYVCETLSDQAYKLDSFLNLYIKGATGVGIPLGLVSMDYFMSSTLYPESTDHGLSVDTIIKGNDALQISIKDNQGFFAWIGLEAKNADVFNIYHIHRFKNIRLDPDANGYNRRFFIDAYDSVLGTWLVMKGYTNRYNLSKCCEFKNLKACFRPKYRSLEVKQTPCDTLRELEATRLAAVNYIDYLEKQKNIHHALYRQKCASAFPSEIFQMSEPNLQHHYTLYYYDVAGNLIRTVPPAGVKMINQTYYKTNSLPTVFDTWRNYKFNEALDNLEATDGSPNYDFTHHKLSTFYQYNTLNEVVRQKTPDGGTSYFFYDRLGRLVFSQNAKQAALGNVYSYTNYDSLGRIQEVGEIALAYPVSADSLKSSGTYFDTRFNAGFRSQITRTFYDAPYSSGVSSLFGTEGQTNLRNRVSATCYLADMTADYSYATHFSYDVHGNVKTMIQEFAELESFNSRYKRIDYRYDLVSGNVNKVCYQQGQPDQFYHKYEYDADNRITDVYTSKDNLVWEKDANYDYYLHGPLARTVIGEDKVQGMDYAYTIHGWLKTVNSSSLNKDFDMGSDGKDKPQIARDAIGYTLGYYSGDYQSIISTNHVAHRGNSGFGGKTEGLDLYNGNISYMSTANRAMVNSGKGILGMNYQYDQLNRIKTSESFLMLNRDNNTWNGVDYANLYSTSYSYDGNGNILSLERYGYRDVDTLMDDLTYHYYPGTNQLKAVEDAVVLDNLFSTQNGGVEDLNSGQDTTGNYRYDAIGNLISDKQEQIRNIEWTVYGKVSKVQRADTSGLANMQFKYDASGNRVMKLVKPTPNPITWRYTYYVRDAQGNVMAVYNLQNGLEDSTLNDSMITNWLISEYGLSGVAGMFNKYYKTNTAFLTGLIQVLEDTDYDTLVINEYSLSSILSWDNSLATDILLAYNNNSSDYNAVIDSLMRRYLDDVVDAITGSHFSNLMADVLQADGISFLNCFSESDLQTMYTDVIGGTPPSGKASIISALMSPMYRNDLITELYTSYNSDCVSYLKSCFNTTVLTNVLKTGTNLSHYLALQDIATGLGAAELVTFFTTNGDAVSWRPKYLLKTYGTHAYILNVIAQNSPSDFIENSITQDRTVLDQLLVDLEWFTTTTYVDLVGRNYGNEVVNTMLSDLGISLTYRQQLSLSEHDIYGSSRLGVRKDTISLYKTRFTATAIDTTTGAFTKDSVYYTYQAAADTLRSLRQLGHKNYELTNHLGNVLAVVTDKRQYLTDAVILGDTFALWDAYIAGAQDYYPFGMLMPNRIYSDTTLTEQAVYNITKYEVVKYDNNFKTGRQRWQGSSGMTTSVANGKLEASSTVVDEDVTVYYHTKPGKKYRLNLDILFGTADSIDVKIHNQGPQTLIYSDANAPEGMNEYEFTAATDSIRLRLKRKDHNHQGALSFYVDRAVLRIIRDTLYQDTVYLATGNNYRYGFNGQERDNEFNGVGNSFTAMFWQYDSRLGRRWNVDPIIKEFESPFAVFGSNPIWFMDPLGADWYKGNESGATFWREGSEESVEVDGETYTNIGAQYVEIVDDGIISVYNQNKNDIYDVSTATLFENTDGSYSMSGLQNVKNIHFVFEELTPSIYNFTLDELRKHPDYFILTYNGGSAFAKSNRLLASNANPLLNCGFRMQKDEFPYASTFQGGSNSIMRCVPGRENSLQGSQLSILYRTMTAGENFFVVPVPKGKTPTIVPVFNPGRYPINIPNSKSPVSPDEKDWTPPNYTPPGLVLLPATIARPMVTIFNAPAILLGPALIFTTPALESELYRINGLEQSENYY